MARRWYVSILAATAFMISSWMGSAGPAHATFYSPRARSSQAQVGSTTAGVCMFGGVEGVNGSQGQVIDDYGLYCFGMNVGGLPNWSTKTSTLHPCPRKSVRMVFDPNLGSEGSLMMFGGSGFNDAYENHTNVNNDPIDTCSDNGTVTAHDLAELWRYDVSTSEWSLIAPTGGCNNGHCPTARQGEAMWYFPTGKVVMGFGSHGGNARWDVWSYDDSTNQWTERTSLEDSSLLRNSPAFFYDGAKYVVAEGWDGSAALDDAWSFTSLTGSWTQVCSDCTSYAGVQAPRGEYSNQQGKALMFGGLVQGTPPFRLHDTYTVDAADSPPFTLTSPGGDTPPSVESVGLGIYNWYNYHSQTWYQYLVTFGGTPSQAVTGCNDTWILGPITSTSVGSWGQVGGDSCP